jgi:hypothetical protein
MPAGLTAVECLLATVVLAAVMLALLATMTAGQQHVHSADRSVRAARLAQDLFEEIAARSYSEPVSVATFGPEPDESGRISFDDVDDYSGYSEAPGALVDFGGRPCDAADQVHGRSVTVAYATQDLVDVGRVMPGRLVTVSIDGPDGDQWHFARFIPQP